MPSLLIKDQKKYLKELIAQAYAELGKPPPELETEIPGMDPLQDLGIQLGLQYGQGEQGQARNEALLSQLSGKSGYEGLSPEFIRNMMNDLYYNPALRQFSQEIAPQIETQYGGTEAWRTGDISRAISEATEGVGVGGMREAARLTESELGRKFTAEQSALDRQQAAIGLSAEEEKSPIRFAMQAGDVRRGVANEQAQFNLFKEMRNSPWANPALGVANLVLGQYKVPTGSSGGSEWGNIVSSLLNPAAGMMKGFGGGGGGGGFF